MGFYEKLKTLIEPHANLSAEDCANLLNAETEWEYVSPTWCSRRTLFDVLGFTRAVEVMTTLRSLAAAENAQAPMFKEVVGLLDEVNAGGIDLGTASTQAALDGFVGILSVEEITTLKNRGKLFKSLAVKTLGVSVSAHDINKARSM